MLTERRNRGETRSHLVIDDARPDVDSGNYTCKPSIARPASIKVHVLESEWKAISCFFDVMLSNLIHIPHERRVTGVVRSFPDDFPGALQVSSCPPSHHPGLSLFVSLFLLAQHLSPSGSANS